VPRSLVFTIAFCAACAGESTPSDAGSDGGSDAGTDAGAIGEGVDPSTLDLAPDPSGEWLAGDLHVHATGASNDTGGDSLPADIAATARARGLFFVVLTDHSNSTGSDVTTTDEDPALFNMGPEFPYWDRAAELSVAGEFLMIDGNEVSPVAPGEMPSEPTGHVGCVPADLETFDRSGAFTDRPRGTVTGGEALEQARDRGCFTVLNHPYGVSWTSFDWTSFDYDAVEVWNGTAGFDAADQQGHDAWRCDLLQGRSVTAIGASDNHRVFHEPPGEVLNPALGWPRTYVYAAERTWPAIVEAMRAGRTAIGEGGSFVTLDGYAEDGALGGSHWVRVRGAVSADSRASRVTLTRATACEDRREAERAPVDLTEEVLFERTVDPGAEFDWAIRVDGAPGVYTGAIAGVRGHYGALSGAVLVE